MIGTQIGQFKIVRPLGRGAMGTVWHAEHVALGAKLSRAVKVLSQDLMTVPSVVLRFGNEAAIEATLNHHNVVKVHDYGKLPDGQPYMVLDFLVGDTLEAFLASHGNRPLDPYMALHILCEIAAGIDHAHRNNIVHRDLKPANIFLSVVGNDPHHATVLDFGVAQADKSLANGVETQAGALVGTPTHMPPEQLLGRTVTSAVDVFALAVIAYQMLTGGRLPWQEDDDDSEFGPHPVELYRRQTKQPPSDPRRYYPSLSEAWVTTIVAALDNDPANRPATCGAFVMALGRALPGDGYYPDGIELVRKYAGDILDIGVGSAGETIRATLPADLHVTAQTSSAASRYQLGERLGAGGMAEVFRSTFRSTSTGAGSFERQVAIKRVLPGFSEQPEFAAMFIEEARIVSALSHPNIVSVLDFDKDADGRLFLVMEYVDGRDLASLAESGPLPIPVVIFVAIEILRGLNYAHALPQPVRGITGIVHRDMSPHNVMISREGEVKVMDFGIARAVAASGAVRSAMIRGKPNYMSPEQIQGGKLDARADLFAVGSIFHELLTGRLLFTGTMQEVLGQVLYGAIPRPSTVRPGIAGDVEAVVMKLLERDPTLRYASAELAIEDLIRCSDAPRDGRGELRRLIAARFPKVGDSRPHSSVVSDAGPPTASSTFGQAASQVHPSSGSVRRGRPLLAGALAATVVAGGIVLLYSQRRRTEAAGPSVDAGKLAVSARPEIPVARVPDAAAVVTAATAPPNAVPAAILIPSDAAEVAAPHLDATLPIDAAPPMDAAPIPERGIDAGVAPPRPVPHAPVATGELDIAVEPWAMAYLDGSTGRRLGQTPIHIRVPVGLHHVFLINDSRHMSKTVDVTVTTSKAAVIDETW